MGEGIGASGIGHQATDIEMDRGVGSGALRVSGFWGSLGGGEGRTKGRGMGGGPEGVGSGRSKCTYMIPDMIDSSLLLTMVNK